MNVSGSDPSPAAGLDPVFMRSKFLLRQKHLAISEKYYVGDERGESILFVQRPAHLIRGCLSIIGAVVAFAAVFGVFFAIGFALPESVTEGPAFPVAVVALGFPLALVAAFVVGVVLSAKRHVTFYRDDTKAELMLQVEQDRKFAPFVPTYTVKDPSGSVLARLKKNILFDFFRKRWTWEGPDGRLITIIKEDSVIAAILRRLLGPLFGILRTNFVFLTPDTDEIIGQFNRKFTLLDRYVLDISADSEGRLDPRVALAAGVMLDTGERR